MPVKVTVRKEQRGLTVMAFATSTTANVLKAAFVLTAPICAPLLSAAVSGHGLSQGSGVAAGIYLIQQWLLALALIAWVLLALVWLSMHLFSSGHHYLKPLHETLTIPALVLYLAAFAPLWPYLILPPFGSSV